MTTIIAHGIMIVAALFAVSGLITCASAPEPVAVAVPAIPQGAYDSDEYIIQLQTELSSVKNAADERAVLAKIRQFARESGGRVAMTVYAVDASGRDVTQAPSSSAGQLFVTIRLSLLAVAGRPRRVYLFQFTPVESSAVSILLK